jgi:HEAT repeat protein
MYAALIFLLCNQLEAKPELTIPQLVAIIRAEPQILSQESRDRDVEHLPGIDAAIELQDRGEPAIKPLAELVKDPSPRVRENALWVLAMIYDSLPAQRAILPAVADKEPAVRIAAIKGLYAFDENDIRTALLTRLQDQAAEVRYAAVEQLYLRESNIVKKPKLSDSQIDEVTKALSLRLQDEDIKVRVHTPGTLASYHSGKVLPALLAVANDENNDLRREVAYALGNIGDRRALQVLYTLLDDREISVVQSAIGALGRLADPRSTDHVMKSLEAEHPWNRVAAAHALGTIGDRRAVEPLCKCLQTKDGDLINAVGEALGKLGDARAVEPLIDKLKENPWCTGTIIKALGELNDPRAIDPILAAAFRVDPEKRVNEALDAAEKALPRIKHPDVLLLAAKYALADQKAYASYVMRRMIGKMIDRDFLSDPESFERWAKEEYAELRVKL